MSRYPVDRYLFFGLLALQNGFVNRDQLVAAFGKWVGDKSRPLDQLMVESGALHVQARDALMLMVDQHLRQNDNDVHKSFQGLSGSDVADVCDRLETLNDNDVRASLVLLPVMDRLESEAPGIGQWTSTGQRFRFLRPLPGGRGGMGIITVARDEELGREVALKQIQPDKARHDIYRDKFQFEAEITGNLEHPGIIPVYGCGTDDLGNPFYAMRLVQGDHLGQAIRDFHSPPSQTPEALRALDGKKVYSSVEFLTLVDRFIDACQAVRYAHARGVLHRDLKPGNILLGRFGETLIIDWGLARLRSLQNRPKNIASKSVPPRLLEVPSGSGSPTMEGSFLGTPGYASPEQAQGDIDKIAEQSDIYSLGAILYHIITGIIPANGTNGDIGEVLDNTIRGHLVQPGEIDRGIPAGLTAIAMHAMSLRPEDRYQQVGDLIDDLVRWKADQPVSVLPETLARRSGRWARRHRGLAATIVGALMLVTTISVLTAWIINNHRIANKKLALHNASLAIQEREARSVAAQAKERAEELQTIAESEAARAINSARLAKQEQERLDKTIDFFVRTFRLPDPSFEGKDLRVVDMLDAAIIGAKSLLDDDKSTLATLLDTFALTYSGLGLHEKALDVGTQALDLAEQVRDRHDIVLLRIRTNVAVSYAYEQQYDTAMTLLDSVEAALNGQNDPGGKFLLRVQRHRASVLSLQGEFQSAIEMLEPLVIQLKGKDTDGAIEAMDTLAECYHGKGDPEKSLDLIQQIVAIKKDTYGEDHLETLFSLNNLAVIYSANGDNQKAWEIYKNIFFKVHQQLGPTHPTTLQVAINMATTHEPCEEALLLFQDILRIRNDFGNDAPLVVDARFGMAQMQSKLGRHMEAVENFEEVYKHRRAKLGANHWETLDCARHLGQSLVMTGETERGIALIREGIEGVKGELTPAAIARLLLTNSQFLVEQHSGLAITEAMLREAKAIAASGAVGLSAAAEIDSALGWVLTRQASYEEAETLLIQSIESMKLQREKGKSPGADPLRKPLRETIQHLIQLYRAWERPEREGYWLKELADLDET